METQEQSSRQDVEAFVVLVVESCQPHGGPRRVGGIDMTYETGMESFVVTTADDGIRIFPRERVLEVRGANLADSYNIK